ncbi:DNA-directed RNA polymerase III subunit RPC7-like isoform X2 [Oryzias latipes]|uniref:DNA-directed RNA polymerase III subunit RPC7-like isoform X2 n=1 Tax=Oryzias latipes TaxID=8090 RepID=UPI0002A4B851|nr:DNA-directed RNA polymerase III subunit RPC7-like isoform X2 [Oryzias latipes]
MAGRGRGRRPFGTDSSISRGEGLPPGLQQPTPVFPVMEQKPLPLAGGEEAEYLLALKQDFRGVMKNLPFFIKPAAAQRDVQRYSDKYHSSEQTNSLTDWNLDWRRFPRELQVHIRRRVREGLAFSTMDSSVPVQKKKKKKEEEEVLLKLETLEKKEEHEQSSEEEEGGVKKKPEEEEGAEAEEEYDEEELEEETDYIMSYFDNGEEFGGDSDDNMDEAIY